jgi:H/ACA ribonucleoprotein complex subunit 1
MFDEGPPAVVTEVGAFMHPAESELFCRSTQDRIPYFNAPIFLENKQKIGKVEEVLGPTNEVYFTIKPDPGMKAESFTVDQKFFIAPDKLLPMSRFLPPPPGTKPSARGGGRGGGRGTD